MIVLGLFDVKFSPSRILRILDARLFANANKRKIISIPILASKLARLFLKLFYLNLRKQIDSPR